MRSTASVVLLLLLSAAVGSEAVLNPAAMRRLSNLVKPIPFFARSATFTAFHTAMDRYEEIRGFFLPNCTIVAPHGAVLKRRAAQNYMGLLSIIIEKQQEQLESVFSALNVSTVEGITNVDAQLLAEHTTRLARERSELSKQLTAEQEQAQALETELKNAQEHLSELQSQRASEAEAHETELKKAQERVSELQTQRASEAQAHETELKKAQERVSELQTQSASEARAHGAELQRVQAHVEELTQQLAANVSAHKSELEQAQERMSELQTQSASEARAHKAELQRVQAHVEELTQQLAANVSAHKTLEAELQNEITRQHGLATSNQTLLWVTLEQMSAQKANLVDVDLLISTVAQVRELKAEIEALQAQLPDPLDTTTWLMVAAGITALFSNTRVGPIIVMLGILVPMEILSAYMTATSVTTNPAVVCVVVYLLQRINQRICAFFTAKEQGQVLFGDGKLYPVHTYSILGALLGFQSTQPRPDPLRKSSSTQTGGT